MTYYKTWQQALMDFIRHNGTEYESEQDLYALMTEFEVRLRKNVNGAYYLKTN